MWHLYSDVAAIWAVQRAVGTVQVLLQVASKGIDGLCVVERYVQVEKHVTSMIHKKAGFF